MMLYSRSQRPKDTPKIFLNWPGTPATQKAEAGEFVRPRPFVVSIENLDSKPNQPTTQNAARPHGTNL